MGYRYECCDTGAKENTYCPHQMRTTSHILLNMFSDLIILFTYQDMNEYSPGNDHVSPTTQHFWVDDFPFSRWDMLVPWRVVFAMIAKNICVLLHTRDSWLKKVHSFDKTSCLLDLIQCDICFLIRPQRTIMTIICFLEGTSHLTTCGSCLWYMYL